MTHFGLCPSFCGPTSRLPVFTDLLNRGRQFEVFNADGTPTGVASPMSGRLPARDGRLHGLRLWMDADGLIPGVSLPAALRVKQSANALFVYGADWSSIAPFVAGIDNSTLATLGWFEPVTLRTLDWQRANDRVDFSKPRVKPTDLLQGSDLGMALELQVDAANAIGAHLWWTAPPRYDTPVSVYQGYLEECLYALLRCDKSPILEMGNESWNTGFEWGRWLRQQSPKAWPALVAAEVDLLADLAKSAFGVDALDTTHRIFVGGFIQDPTVLTRILGAMQSTPALAGPAAYIGPTKADRVLWESEKVVPTQVQLEASCRRRMDEVSMSLATVELSLPGGTGLACYEAGQSMIAGFAPWRGAAIQAQREPWLQGLYRDLRSELAVNGVEIANWYSAATPQSPPAPTDVFGLLEGPIDRRPPLPKALGAHP